MARELRAIFTLSNLLLLIAAALLTAVFSYFGIDWMFYQETRRSVFIPLVYTAGLAGFIMPAVVPLSMYAIGLMWHDATLKRTAWALVRAVLYALAIIALLKGLTGRAHPEGMTVLQEDITKEFAFGILQKGIFWGWPSSHAGSAFALSSTVILLYKNVFVRVAAATFAVVVGLGAAIGFHWLSDVIAGATIGMLVGFAVANTSPRP